jgi:hypothetical protein
VKTERYITLAFGLVGLFFVIVPRLDMPIRIYLWDTIGMAMLGFLFLLGFYFIMVGKDGN